MPAPSSPRPQPQATKPVTQCPYCEGRDIIKKGARRKKYETGLHYNYYRDYDPTMGRYIQVDPIGLGGGINPYIYVGGNPVLLTDPEGNIIPLYIALPLIGGIIGGVSDMLSAGPCESKGEAFARGFISGVTGTLVGMGVMALTANPFAAGAAAGASSNLMEQSLSEADFNPMMLGGATLFGGLGGSAMNKLLPTVGRLPSLTIPRTLTNFGPNSQRLVGQEANSGVLGGLSQYFLNQVLNSQNSAQTCLCKQ